MTDCFSIVIGARAHFLVYFFTGKAVVSMCQKFTPEQLKNMDMETKDGVIFQMQDRLDKLEHDYENLIEQIRLANQQRFGRHTEKPDGIAGQLSFLMRRKRIAWKMHQNQQ